MLLTYPSCEKTQKDPQAKNDGSKTYVTEAFNVFT